MYGGDGGDESDGGDGDGDGDADSEGDNDDGDNNNNDVVVVVVIVDTSHYNHQNYLNQSYSQVLYYLFWYKIKMFNFCSSSKFVSRFF